MKTHIAATSGKNHVRFLAYLEGRDAYVPIIASAHIQAKLVSERIEELRKTLSPYNHREEATLKMIKLLEEYEAVLSESQTAEERAGSHSGNFYIEADTVPVSEWLGFENVYQVHCPRLFLNESVRNVRIPGLSRSRSRWIYAFSRS